MKALTIATLLASSAYAGPIFIGEWYEFGFDPNHAPMVAGCLPEDPSGLLCRPDGLAVLNLDTPPWTFSSPGPVTLQITDAFLPGDSFTVFDFGVLVGSTPPVSRDGPSCGFNPNDCFTNPAFSHGTFNLPPGPHSITVNVEPAQILGEGFIRALGVPEPSFGVFGGVMLLACYVRHRKR